VATPAESAKSVYVHDNAILVSRNHSLRWSFSWQLVQISNNEQKVICVVQSVCPSAASPPNGASHAPDQPLPHLAAPHQTEYSF
jgi:hypothetical protein